MQNRLDYLNKEQYEAVTSNSKYIRVIAGAGSGKTRVLTERIIYLVNEMGFPYNSIVAITFTNKAANEMRERVASVLPADNIPLISTFHSFCVRFLRRTISRIGYTSNFTIIDDDDQKQIITKIIKDLHIDDDRITPKNTIEFISGYKNAGEGYMEAISDSIGFEIETKKAMIFKKYDLYLANNNYLDFDDLIIKTVQILENYSDIREKYQHYYNCILVDEFQDTNDIQYKLVKLLMNDSTFLFVVGDPDQTIYTWRGANIDIILNMKKEFKDIQDIVLNTNYRSTSNILNCANSLIKHNAARLEKDLIANNGVGGDVMFYQAPKQTQESRFVADRILDLKQRSKSLKYSSFAILYRSNYYSRDIEQMMMNMHIPYRIYGSVKFFNRKEIKDAISFLKLINNPTDYLALSRIVTELRIGIGLKKLEELGNADNCFQYLKDKYKNEKTQYFINAIDEGIETLKNEQDVKYSFLLEKLLEKSKYIDHLQNDNEEERIENIKKGLLPYFDQYQKDHPSCSLDEVLQELAIFSAQDEMEEKDVVSLMTIHTAKGLEFDYVFVIGLEEGVFPPARTIMAFDDSLIEEERRLAYVAFTRAKKQLILTCNVGFMPMLGKNGTPSRFISDIRGMFKYCNRFKDEVNSVHYEKPKPTLKANFSVNNTNVDYNIGDKIEHKMYGFGKIVGVEDSSISIQFDDSTFGTKKISKRFTGIRKV